MKYVILRKMGGFYNSFDNDAIIISYLCDYKVKNSKTGFPISAIDKVTNILDDNKVNYIIKEKGIDKIKKNFNNGNKYNKILIKGKEKYDIDFRIDNIINDLSNLSSDKLDKLIDIIEDYINE